MLGQCISLEKYSRFVVDGGKHAAPLVDLKRETLEACYNRTPFLVSHRLADHPHFALPRLFELCRRLPPKQIQFRLGNIPGDAELDTSYDDYQGGLTLDDAIDHFEERQAYICISNPEKDAEYRPVIEGLMADLAVNIDPLDPQMTWYSTYVFISAQNSTTPYHMDREMNFLLQIRGGKTVCLWDPADEEIMSDAQKDYLLAHEGSRPSYRPSFESKATVFQLRPGVGVHHPFIAPHRVHTGTELSISLALTFRTRRSDTWRDAHIVNARMRRLVMRPGPVGHNVWRDRAKTVVRQVWLNARRRQTETFSI
jgi:hypothetical protein